MGINKKEILAKVNNMKFFALGIGKFTDIGQLVNAKWKEYHYDELPSDIQNELFEKIYKEEKRKDKFGDIKPILHADFDNTKFVCIGDTIRWSDEWKTFTDFLIDYLLFILGEKWCNDEWKKPKKARHQIIKWRDGLFQHFEKNRDNSKEIQYAIPDGMTKAYLQFSYDLYLIQHHSRLQKEIIRRLKIKDHFQSTRYELFVASTLIRAGYDIEFEDETDKSQKHTEFIAKHKSLNYKFAVEAKSKHRKGVLDFGDGVNYNYKDLGIFRLLVDAFRKIGRSPYIIFIDLNIPAISTKRLFIDKIPNINHIIERAKTRVGEYQDPFNLIIFTNHPYHYGIKNQPTPRENAIFCMAGNPIIKFKDLKELKRIYDIADNYGKIPNYFDN